MIQQNAHTANQGVVKTEVLDLISIICDYQSKRNYRSIFGGKEGDPINLMWEEFKNFLVCSALAQVLLCLRAVGFGPNRTF